MSFAIVTDSSCNLPNEIIDKYDLHIVSLVFMVEGKPYQSYVKGEENDLKRFYTMMRNKNQITTSCANEAACTAVIEPLLKSGQDVLFIGFPPRCPVPIRRAQRPAKSSAKRIPTARSSRWIRSARHWARGCS